MKIARKLFALAGLIIFSSYCFGAKEIKSEEGYTIAVRDDGKVAFIDNSDKDRWWYYSGVKIEAEEIFEFNKNSSLSNYLLIFPVGIYNIAGFNFCNSTNKTPLSYSQYNLDYDYQACFSRVGKFLFFLDKEENKLYFAHEGDKVMLEYPIGTLGFAICGIEFNHDLKADSIVISGKDIIHNDHFVYLTLDEINKKYSELLSKEFEEFEVIN